ncbi:MAG: NADPH:quinone oxidoreductase family protein [Halioglobus sp.]
MKAWRVEEFGDPRTVWQLQENAPESEPGPGELKIKVEAAGLGLPDVLMCHNNYPLTPPLPFTPSQEAAGRVVAVGEGVDTGLIGQRVMGTTQFQAQCGGLAEFCLMHSAAALPVPESMSGTEAAGFFIPYMTAWTGLARRGQLAEGETLLVLGASGSSGAAAVQLGKALGARVIAVAGGPAKAEFCASIGADEVIDHRSQDITVTARELTDGKGVNMVFDPVGGKPGRAGFKALGFEGRFVIIGYASGEWAQISLVETLMTNISLVGAMPVGFSPDVMRGGVAQLIGFWEQGKLKLSSQQVFDFDHALDAIKCIADGKVEGKVVVSLSSGD